MPQTVYLVYDNAIICCRDVLNKLKKEVASTGFETIEEEIHFFKNIKPQVYSTMAFFRMLTIIETHCPQHSIHDRIAFFQKRIHKIQNFMENHNEFVEYYRTGQIYSDEKYFTRNFDNLVFNNDNFEYIVYPEFSTVYDGTLSKVMAYERLEEFLANEINKLQNGELASDKESEKTYNKWTENLTSLAELIYSLIETKAIDHGNIKVNELTGLFGKVLNIPDGNIYNAYRLILTRKKEKTVFIDKMRNALTHKIDNSFE